MRGGGIPSRALATDQAIVEAAVATTARTVIDLGSGEGWLVRALSARGLEVLGVDGSAALIEAARAHQGGGRHLCLDYGRLDSLGERFELAIANFSLLGEQLDAALRAIAGLLDGPRVLLIQTLHPLTAGPPYRDGWRREDFCGFGSPGETWAPMPWYFRTLGSWIACVRAAGFAIERVREPLHPDTELPVSLLIEARAV